MKKKTKTHLRQRQTREGKTLEDHGVLEELIKSSVAGLETEGTGRGKSEAVS